MIFEWNEWNVYHIGKHGVTASEAEFVTNVAEPPFPRQIEDEKQLVWGRTPNGRYLQVVFVYLADEDVDYFALSERDRIEFEGGKHVSYVIHAMEMTAVQKRQYRRLRR